jgi:hypothetical protein
MNVVRTLSLLIAGVAALISCDAVAFGEERGSHIDTQEMTSTHHLYLTRALAVCAGFRSNGNADPFHAPADAERIAIADQLSDSERLHHAGGRVSNCSGKPYRMPTASALGCPANSGTRVIIPVTGEQHMTGLLPLPTWQPEEGCFTSRFGPYSNDFHFPDAQRVAVLRQWAFGDTATLDGTARFTFGGYFDSPWGGDCNASRSERIETGAITPGSPEALGIYLHAIGDFHSHSECLAHWGDRQDPPWPTHTVSTRQTGCAFIDHARELGCPANNAHDSVFTPPPEDVYVQHAVAAAMTIYDELQRYRQQRSAVLQTATATLGDTPAHREWLATHVRRFVTGWPYLGGALERRQFANALAARCAALTPAQRPANLPRLNNETDCPPQGTSE